MAGPPFVCLELHPAAEEVEEAVEVGRGGLVGKHLLLGGLPLRLVHHAELVRRDEGVLVVGSDEGRGVGGQGRVQPLQGQLWLDQLCRDVGGKG